jgi:hypothetical protein
MKGKKTVEKESVQLSPIVVKEMKLELEGLSPLLMHKFSDKKQTEMVEKQQQKGARQKEARDIDAEVQEAIHYDANGKVAFPACGFKRAAIEAAPYIENLDKKLAKGSFHVMGDLVPISFSKQVVNKTTVRLSGPGRTAMVRFRPEFQDWSCVLHIKYNPSQISSEQIVNLFNVGGFHIGVGEWTPQHNGSYGMFQVKTS